jgi:exopolysaccharide biosynthesis polyprenyl glycosylphosphotransferase
MATTNDGAGRIGTRRLRPETPTILLRLGDIALGVACLTLAEARLPPDSHPAFLRLPALSGLVILILLWQGWGLYSLAAARHVPWRRVGGGLAATGALLALIWHGAGFTLYTMETLAGWLGLSGLSMAAERMAVARLTARWVEGGRIGHRVVIAGLPPLAATEVAAALHRDVGITFVGLFVPADRADEAGPAGVPVLGTLADLPHHPMTAAADRVLIALPWSAKSDILAVLRSLRTLPVGVCLAPEALGHGLGSGTGAPIPLLPPPATAATRLIKAVEDRTLALALLILMSPVMAAIAVLIRLDSSGPILFRQTRNGFHGKPLTIAKFRTLRHPPSDPDGRGQCPPDDPRLTRVGRVLRRTRLDELPQLFNVLAGDMSLVGPRPYPDGLEIDQQLIRDVLAEYARRASVKPGMTGWAQVNGRSGPVASLADLQMRLEHDLYYINHWSPRLDATILWRTALMVLRRRH